MKNEPPFRQISQPDFTEPISLRDWFAGMVIQGMYASGDVSVAMYQNATEAYRQADIMLEQRGKD